MIRIDSVMERDVITAKETDTVMTLVEMLEQHRVGAVIIVDTTGKVPIGVVTERDIVYALKRYKSETLDMQANKIMSTPVLALPPHESLRTGAELMQTKRIRRLPVVKDTELVGIVTHRDIVAALNKSHSVLETKNEALQEKANRDPLTGLYNKGYIMEQLAYHMVLAQRSRDTMALIFIDIDHFKRVNDTYGHLCGDAILQQLASIFKNRSRAVNIVGRYGGEEFVIIGPISNHKSASNMAERLRQEVEQHSFLWEQHEIRLTISIGVCIYDQSLTTHEEMIQIADNALYRAKAEGRNRVVIGEPNEKFPSLISI